MNVRNCLSYKSHTVIYGFKVDVCGQHFFLAFDEHMINNSWFYLWCSIVRFCTQTLQSVASFVEASMRIAKAKKMPFLYFRLPFCSFVNSLEEFTKEQEYFEMNNTCIPYDADEHIPICK